jgi:hypothetical protein
MIYLKRYDEVQQRSVGKIKQQIEYHMEQDHNLTDVTINYQLRIPERGTRNYLQLSVKIEQ